MRGLRKAVPVAVAVGVCAVCCAPLVVVSLVVLTGLGAAFTGLAAGVVGGAPWWLLALLIAAAGFVGVVVGYVLIARSGGSRSVGRVAPAPGTGRSRC